MTDAQVHLITNHLPLILPIIGVLVLIIALIIQSNVSKRIGYFLIALGGLYTIPAFFSGEGAEHIVEELGRSHDLIHEHEEIAETFAYSSYLLSVLALIALYMSWKKKTKERILMPIVLIGALALSYLAFETGRSGGKISHPEVLKD